MGPTMTGHFQAGDVVEDGLRMADVVKHESQFGTVVPDLPLFPDRWVPGRKHNRLLPSK